MDFTRSASHSSYTHTEAVAWYRLADNEEPIIFDSNIKTRKDQEERYSRRVERGQGGNRRSDMDNKEDGTENIGDWIHMQTIDTGGGILEVVQRWPRCGPVTCSVGN